MISIVVGATRTLIPCRWQVSISSTARSCGKVRIGDQHLVDHVEVALELLERPHVLEPVLFAGLERDESDRLDLGVLERVRDGIDVLAAADQHGAPVVAGGAQQRAGNAVEPPPERRHVEEGEEERAVEDVVGREVDALDERVHEQDHRHLEERRDDPREARAHRPVAVQAGAREQENRDEHGERRKVVRALPRELEVRAPLHDQLDLERGEDREEDADGVEDAEREHARDPARGVELAGCSRTEAAGARGRRGTRQGRRRRPPVVLPEALLQGRLPRRSDHPPPTGEPSECRGGRRPKNRRWWPRSLRSGTEPNRSKG